MRPPAILVIALGWVACVSVWAGETGDDPLLKELQGKGEATKRSAAEWEAAHAKALDALLPKLTGDDLEERGEANRVLARIGWHASRPGAAAERTAAEKALLARLRPDLPKLGVIAILEGLERIGTEEAVGPLARLLDARETELPSVREHARRALLKNPSPKAVDALRAALAKAEGAEWRVGLINALGERRDKAAAPALIALVKDDDQGVKLAAIEALARIGDKGAANLLAAASKGAPPRVWRIAIVSYLLLADRLVEADDKAAALKLYQNLLGAEDFVKCGALIGVGRAGGPAELAVIFESLADPDPEIRGAAMTALNMMPAAAVNVAVTEKLRTAKPEVRVVLLRLLAGRGEASAAPTLVAAASDADEAVRIAAYEGLAALGDARALPPLIAALAKAQGKEQEAVRNAAARIRGKPATEALVKAMDDADAALRVELLKTLAARKDAAAVPALLQAASDKEEAVRSEALKALGGYAGAEALDGLVALLVKADDKDRAAAERALSSVCARIEDEAKRTAPILAALPKAQGPARGALLRVLGKLGGANALEAVRAALKDANPDVKDAAIRALADWPDGAVAADLLAVAKGTDNLAHHVLALRGCLRVLALPGERTAEARLALLADAMKAARRPDEKREILGGMGSVPSPEALKAVEPFLGDEALKAEAAIAAVKIAGSLIGTQPDAAKAALKKLLDGAPNDDVKKQAQEALDQLDKTEDYITAWEVSGPYTKSGKEGQGLHDEVFPPESEMVGGAAVPREKIAWEIIPPGGGERRSDPFHMDLDKKFGDKQNAVAYLRTCVWSPADQKARLEFGSDDGAKVWLNGALVINANQARSFAVASDKAEVVLKKGWNALLVKVWNGGGDWGMAARLRRPDGSRLEGLRAALRPE
ncbi:MAG TPA: HEAT repeat domain-containing protein [Planctomycetota bacterium]|nr:HEAT repeat domain-containing protein [Planctomycetota bacterium]HRR81074.1 HEAT repeat domain-containing protein [Planctomycetota bacterium]HRT94336.1 HEAT repeat domain-containing protein [Planctomycetota bacterium]